MKNLFLSYSIYNFVHQVCKIQRQIHESWFPPDLNLRHNFIASLQTTIPKCLKKELVVLTAKHFLGMSVP